ncbi:aldose epimerase family protein [Psychroserpens sp. Hel_I_66]|uniref:aldose epimerase family protein n=1 Tax=Psychroserpens sp. Hel_I_66 TaxID=1250004 RepID=UPI00064676A8|nr:aldose epimerase family protein [Psychroserpens sp. Hel_I_66]
MSTLKTAIISNANGMELHVSNFGAAIISLKVPNKQGAFTEVVVGLSSPLDYLKDDYLDQNRCLGSSIGRYAGRISGGGYKIDGIFYKLSQREHQHLHGGFKGFDKRYWDFESVERNENPTIKLSYESAHLEEGHPGHLKVTVTYQITENNELIITYNAQTDKPTHVNLTNHSYFNLCGNGTILNHKLQIASNRYLEVDENTLPTGRIVSSEGTIMDRRQLDIINKNGFKGYDDTFMLSSEVSCAKLICEETGIEMIVDTNQPALVVFTPQNFDNLSLKEGLKYSDYPAICFEAQNYPDAPNHMDFPSSLLQPSEVYENITSFKFSIIH